MPRAAHRTSTAAATGLVFLLVLPAVSFLGCGGPGRDPDLILISVDTLRPDHLGIYGYDRDTSPNLDRFFSDGRVYTNAYSTSASTAPSVVSLLTGRLPHEHRVRLLYQLVPEEVGLVNDHLPPRYQTAAFVSNIVLTEEALGIAGRFDHYDDFVDERESKRKIWERSAERTTDAALEWLAGERDASRPLFLWVHYIDPHGPYRTPEGWERSFRHEQTLPVQRKKIVPYMRESGVENAWRYVDAYDEEIAYTDSQVGRLLDHFGPRLDDALVIFTADHGETMIEHEVWFTHGFQVYDAIVRVPLLVRGPGVEPGRSDRPAHGIDAAPTLLLAAGAAVPPAMPAVDLRTSAGLLPDRQIAVEATAANAQWRAVIQGGSKAVLKVAGPGRTVRDRRSYDLEADPRETRPAEWRTGNPASRALIELVRSDPDPSGIPEQYQKGMQLRAPKVAPRVDEDTLERLQQLGYAE